MLDTLNYAFEELPLIVANGFEAGHVNGSAEINFSEDGEWSVGAIYLDGFKDREHKLVEVDTRSEIRLNIVDALENGARKGRIEAEISSALESMGVSPRSDYAEHNTHHFAFSGAR